jgi:hypothetical protein
MRKILMLAVAGVAVVALSAGLAGAAVTLNQDGTGFVGKGDVQTVYGWNNQSLQANAGNVDFRVSSASEVSWICTKDNGNTQERARTTTTEGLVTTVARERNQITGFNLTGFDGGSETATDGPPLNSCPNFWELTTPAGDPVPVGGGGVEVSINGTDWYPIG